MTDSEKYAEISIKIVELQRRIRATRECPFIPERLKPQKIKDLEHALDDNLAFAEIFMGKLELV